MASYVMDWGKPNGKCVGLIPEVIECVLAEGKRIGAFKEWAKKSKGGDYWVRKIGEGAECFEEGSITYGVLERGFYATKALEIEARIEALGIREKVEIWGVVIEKISGTDDRM